MRLEIEAACRLFNLSIYVIPDAADVAPTKHGTGAVVAYDEGDVCAISALGRALSKPRQLQKERQSSRRPSNLKQPEVAVRWVIDNAAAVRRLPWLRRERWQPFWHGISEKLAEGTEVEWIPSHEKQIHWRAQDWGVDADLEVLESEGRSSFCCFGSDEATLAMLH